MLREDAMARRGEALSEHILFVAKDVFLEMGFERASMDVIAARAETSKRTLYAHFENKENLYLAVVGLVRNLFLGGLKTPADYPGETEEVLVQFCSRFVEMLFYEHSIQMCRVSMAEAKRFPEGSAQFHDVIFAQVEERLSSYISQQFDLSPEVSTDTAQKLMGRLLYPRFPRALFGLDQLSGRLDESISPDFDFEPVRRAVWELMGTM